MILDCPVCETQFEVDEDDLPFDPGEIIECPDCIGAFLVENDGSLTPGEVDGKGKFYDTEPA